MRSVLTFLCLLSMSVIGAADTAYGGLSIAEYFKKGDDVFCRQTPVGKKGFWPEYGKDFRGTVYARVDVVREYKLDGENWVISGIPEGAEKIDPKSLGDDTKKPHEEAKFIGERWDGTTYVQLKGLSEKDLAALWAEGTLPEDYTAVLVKNPPEVVYSRLSDKEGRDAEATPGNLKLAKAIKRCAFPPKAKEAGKGKAEKVGENKASSDTVAKSAG